ncbi:class I SAM-dependent methyltransferase, partial [Candidatus Peregrinibacteria bacterium]|nr:class I SAM-dependent methyltransferase [Candidatus Peregrinibacteria bacterium]
MVNEGEQHEVPERGYGMGYQESVDIESRCLFGMEADEFYRRQVGLVLDEIPTSLYGDTGEVIPRKLESNYKLPEGVKLGKKAKNAGMQLVDEFDLGLGAGKKVLDLAVGEGDTSRYLATSGANVEAREYESYLVKRGKEKDVEVRGNAETVEDVQAGVRGRAESVFGNVNYAQGDYSKTKESVGEGEQFDAITCLSRSFIYLGERENYVNALKDFYDLLEPGGKVVLQSRAHIKKGSYS